MAAEGDRVSSTLPHPCSSPRLLFCCLPPQTGRNSKRNKQRDNSTPKAPFFFFPPPSLSTYAAGASADDGTGVTAFPGWGANPGGGGAHLEQGVTGEEGAGVPVRSDPQQQ